MVLLSREMIHICLCILFVLLICCVLGLR